MHVRRANATDVSAMMNLDRASPSAAHWTQQQYEGLFLPATEPQTSERYAWVVEERFVEEDRNSHPERSSEEHAGVLGFLIAHRTTDECELENLVVDTPARRQGVASLLVTQLLAHSRETKVSSIFLEVRESNRAARALYEKFSFKTVSRRQNYYVSPQENAVLYRLNLC
ncbi:MAG: ribosomal protein S18-alanine N-acetyltransferase [Candidatus Sulfotelmatobacter sp.]